MLSQRAYLVIMALLFFLGGLPPVARADDPPSATAKSAAAAIAAFEAKDAAGLKTIATQAKPDPWRVAEALWYDGRLDVAAALANASGQKKLGDYVAARSGAEADPVLATALLAFDAATRGGRLVAGLPHTKAIVGRDLLTVYAILLARGRAAALSTARRLDESKPVWLRTAEAAASIGWVRHEEELLLFGGYDAYRTSDFPAARAAWERRLEILKGLGPPIDVARTYGNLGNVYKAMGDLERARAEYAKAHEMFLEAGDKANAGSVLNNIGILLRKEGREAEALKHFQRAHAVAAESGNRQHMARALLNMSNATAALGHADEALQQLTEAIALQQALGDVRGLAKSHHSLAGLHLALLERDRARTLLDQALAFANQTRDQRLIVHIMRSLGGLNEIEGRGDEAIQTYEHVLKIQERMGLRVDMTRTLQDLASSYAWQGQRAKAEECFHRAIKNAESIGDALAAAFAQLEFARYLRGCGQSAAALVELDKALPVFEKAGNLTRRAIALNVAAEIQYETGNLEKARAIYERVGELSRRAGFETGIQAAENNLGIFLVEEERWQEAKAHYERVLARAEATESDDGVATARTNLSRILMEVGTMEEAVEQANLAAAVHERWGQFGQLISTLANVAAHLGKHHEHAKSLAVAEQALPFFEKSHDLRAKAGLLLAYGQALSNLGRGKEALAQLDEAARILVPSLSGLGNEQGARARSTWASIFTAGTFVAWQDGTAADLFRTMERGRAGEFLESLGSRQEVRNAHIPPELLKAEAALVQRETEAASALRQASTRRDRRRRRNARKILGAIQAEREELAEKTQRALKARAGLAAPTTVELAAFQAGLAKDEALVLYAVDEQIEIALVVTKTTARKVLLGVTGAAHTATRPPPTQPIARELAEALTDPNEDITTKLAAARRALIEPLKLPAAIRQILVSPDGDLGRVPYALLIPDRDVVYVPSATAIGRLASLRGDGRTAILALGDPDYSTITPATVSQHRGAGGRLARLPATRIEVEAITKTRLLGQEATEARLVQALKEQPPLRALHFACHGLIDDVHPMRSSLALTPDPENDGFLTCLDIARLTINADLVVLSACDSSRGKAYASEGIVGLTRAFMLSGAPSVLCSLWKVDDKATSALMVKFYEVWKGDTSAANALVKAQAYVRSQKQWEHPYYWAAWVLWGAP